MKITDAHDYILGKKFISEMKEPYRAEEGLLEKTSHIFNISPTAEQNLKLLESAQKFYELEPDIAKRIPVKKREECFYGMKLEYCSPVIPARAMYFLLKCKNDFGTVNYFPKVFPKPLLKVLFSKGYIAEGYTLNDVLCTIISPNYKPLSLTFPAVSIGEYSEVYIRSTDGIALVPNDIRDKLNYDDIENLEVRDNSIYCGNIPIKFIGSYYGSINSTYDLRGLI